MSDFVVKDSGERVEYASGMRRDVQEGKTLFSLPFEGPMFNRWAEHLTKGAEKYGKNNWQLANSLEEQERFKESAIRHFIQWLRGDRDEDHASAVFFNINAWEYVRERLDTPAPTEPDPEDCAPLLALRRDDYIGGPPYYTEDAIRKPRVFLNPRDRFTVAV